MSYYFPQGAVKLRILPEDFKLTSDASLQSPVEVICQAKKISVTGNDYKTTDTFSLQLDYKNFPFDPRTIRACGVVIYMQDMKKLTPLVPSDDNAIFAGYVDTESISLDDGNQTVSFEGRDFTALMIDQKYMINKPINEQKPLDVAIREFLGQVPALKTIQVINQTRDVLPTLGQHYPDHSDALSGQKNPGSKESYWGMIQDACNRAGLICFMQLENIIITVPRNQADTVGDDIKFIYGKNLKKIEFKRKLGRYKGFNLQVRSRVGKRVQVAKIPEEADASWCQQFLGLQKPTYNVVPVLLPTGQVDPNGSIQPAPYISFSVPNVSTHAQLVKIGKTLYEQYSLQQLEGNLVTREMLGHGPPKNVTGTFSQRTPIGTQLNQVKEYDLTQIKKGQSICIEIDTDDLAAIGRFQDAATREQYLIKHNYPKAIAAIFAKTMGKFSPRFIIKSHTKTLDADNGFELSINFQNIIELTQRGL